MTSGTRPGSAMAQRNAPMVGTWRYCWIDFRKHFSSFPRTKITKPWFWMVLDGPILLNTSKTLQVSGELVIRIQVREIPLALAPYSLSPLAHSLRIEKSMWLIFDDVHVKSWLIFDDVHVFHKMDFWRGYPPSLLISWAAKAANISTVGTNVKGCESCQICLSVWILSTYVESVDGIRWTCQTPGISGSPICWNFGPRQSLQLAPSFCGSACE